MENSLVLRDNIKNGLLEIKTIEDGITHLNKLNTIEVWVKAEKKDAELQNIIAEQKLRTQRILGDLLEKAELKRGVKPIGNIDAPIKSLSDIGLTKRQSSDFQQIASIPQETFELFIQEKKQAVEGAIAELTTAGALRLAKGAHVSNNSGENEWYTPEKYIESAREVMGNIDLDPASSECANKMINAETYYDEASNGLGQKWYGNIWMNPPYAQPLISEFIDKLESESFEQAIILTNNATETKWGQKLIRLSSAICFHASRIRFINPDGIQGDAPLQGQMICYIGKNWKAFIDEFFQYGICLKQVE